MKEARSLVLACIDGSAFSSSVVEHAAWVSRRTGSPLVLLHNIEHQSTQVSDLSGNLGFSAREELMQELTELEARRSKLLLQRGREILDVAKVRAEKLGAVDVRTLKRHDSLAESLVNMEHEIRVLVMGVRGEGHDVDQSSLGSQLEAVIRSMHRPVLVVNREFAQPIQRIMVAYDGSDAAKMALSMVASSPLYHGMECHLVHVGQSGHAPDLLDEAARTLAKVPDMSLVTAMLDGDIEQALFNYQRDHAIEMVVMGAFGHSRLRELLLGSKTVKMLVNSVVPLLLLR